MDAIVTLENFKLMVFALIKFLNQLSEQDKVAAIKFLIATLKASTKENITKSRKTNKGYAFGQNTDVEQWLVADVIEKKSSITDTDDLNYTSQDLVEDFHIRLDDLATSGTFNSQALVSVTDHRNNVNRSLVLSRQEQKLNIIQSLLHENIRYDLDVHKVFECSRNFLRAILNDFVLEHWSNGHLLRKQRKMLGDIPSTTTASITEITDDPESSLNANDDLPEIQTPSNQSGMSIESVNQTDPLDVVDDVDPLKIKPKTARKAKLYTCFQCPKVYNKRKTLAVHYKLHPGYCFDCGETYGTTIEDRVHHNRQYHSKQYPHVCEICGDSMSRNQQYLAHVKTHEKEPTIKSVCKRCGEKFTSIKAYKDHLQTMGHTDGARVCEYCGKSFTDEAMLQQHIKRVHQATKSHKCDHCEKSFDTKSNLTRHMNLHKDVSPSFVCDQCGGSYSTMHTLKEHINDKHTKKKVHTCEVCQREFTNRHLYRNHVVTHSEDRPFACTICTKAFKLKTNLMRHTKRNHGTNTTAGSADAKIKVKRKNLSSDKDESNSSTMTPPPQKKPFQPFSSDSPFYKNNQSIQFQTSNNQAADAIASVPEIEKSRNSQNMEGGIEYPAIPQKAQMPEQFHVVETYMPMKQSPQPPTTPNQNYYQQYFDQSPNLEQNHSSCSQPQAHRQTKPVMNAARSHIQQNHHEAPSHHFAKHQPFSQQKPNNNPYVQGSGYHLPQSYPQEAYHTQTNQHHPMQAQYPEQPLKSQYRASQQYPQQSQLAPHHMHSQQHPYRTFMAPGQNYPNHLSQHPAARQMQPQQRHANIMGHSIYDYNSVTEPPAAHLEQATANHTTQPHQMQSTHPTGNTADHKPVMSPSKMVSKYPNFYEANSQYDHMQSVDTGWNNLQPSLVDSQQNQYMRPEIPKFNKIPTQGTNDDSKIQQQPQQLSGGQVPQMNHHHQQQLQNESIGPECHSQQQQQYSYQNMWATESPQMEYTSKAIDTNIPKHEQLNANTGNSYNSIGNILTNLELLGNNSNLDTSNFELIGSNYDQQYANNSWININKPHSSEEW